ncbi:uncharacterized protein LOC111020479 [Momordica charantia]|uniref:Uncharacterized protein LOC111020479 n=1 Tax=Momordica charantia TaxID=3673 RepID=A0A6J1DHB3_MOMCH|nr:uncharacterized protein LOC111020479 [Momordica charantia]
MVQPANSTNTADRRALAANHGHQREVGAEVVEGQGHEDLGTEPLCRSARITTPVLPPAHPKPSKAESSYNPITPGVITREEFDQLKSKFDAQVEALKARCEKKESSFDDGDLGELSFSSDILEALIPPKFKTPTMKPYDGSKDPKDYVEVFESLMDFQAATDAIKCCAFQIALTGSARLWYRRLPARLISTYSQLRKEFISQFSSRHYDRKTPTHLATIRQKEGETLREYVTRFPEEQLKVAHCSDDSAMCYFLTGLADETLTVKLREEAPATFAEVLQKTKKVIDGQELLRTKTGRPEKNIDQGRAGKDKGKADSKSRDKGPSSSSSRVDYRRSNSSHNQSRPYEHYTPTTIPIFEILTNIEETGMEKLLKRPEKLRGDPEKRNTDKYCRFHRDHGHNTSNYWELKRQIEDLIQDGYFKKFVGKPRSNSVEKKEERKRLRTPPRRDDRPAVINKKKELAREARREVCIIREQRPTSSIAFNHADLEGVHLPHNDALVIAPLIDLVLVRRILVDGGASANILSLSTYLALGWTRSQLKKSPTPLVGFSGESISLEGCIDLPVSIRQDDTQVTQMAEFVVIDGRSAYNAIFGRPIIHSFRAVPSTLHQVLKYSTLNGVGTVRGELKTSRECYASVPKRSSVCALEEQTIRDEL